MKQLSGIKRLFTHFLLGNEFVKASDAALVDGQINIIEGVHLAAIAYAAIVQAQGNDPSAVKIDLSHVPSKESLQNAFAKAGFTVLQ